MSDLGKRTSAEREKHIAYLATLPLKELRKKQDIVNKQKQMAFKEYIGAREGKGSHTTQHWERIGNNLDLMAEDLYQAIDRREFPVKPKKVKK